jgi:hypothetical protein
MERDWAVYLLSTGHLALGSHKVTVEDAFLVCFPQHDNAVENAANVKALSPNSFTPLAFEILQATKRIC